MDAAKFIPPVVGLIDTPVGALKVPPLPPLRYLTTGVVVPFIQ